MLLFDQDRSHPWRWHEIGQGSISWVYVMCVGWGGTEKQACLSCNKSSRSFLLEEIQGSRLWTALQRSSEMCQLPLSVLHDKRVYQGAIFKQDESKGLRRQSWEPGATCPSPSFPGRSVRIACFDDQSNGDLWSACTQGPVAVCFRKQCHC